jgi:hypothetical protein
VGGGTSEVGFLDKKRKMVEIRGEVDEAVRYKMKFYEGLSFILLKL